MTQRALNSDRLDHTLRVEESGHANDRVQPKQSQGICRIRQIKASSPDGLDNIRGQSLGVHL